MKRISRYLKGTSDVGLIYRGGNQCEVTGYSDPYYAGDVDSRRSMTGLDNGYKISGLGKQRISRIKFRVIILAFLS